jgi:hypothetical protein
MMFRKLKIYRMEFEIGLNSHTYPIYLAILPEPDLDPVNSAGLHRIEREIEIK